MSARRNLADIDVERRTVLVIKRTVDVASLKQPCFGLEIIKGGEIVFPNQRLAVFNDNLHRNGHAGQNLERRAQNLMSFDKSPKSIAQDPGVDLSLEHERGPHTKRKI